MTVVRSRRAGFTLVELLVVIGIIALLISILLPSLQKARRAANSIACAANLRSIIQAMHVYASQNNGSIPGSSWTTAQFMFDDVRLGRIHVNTPPFGDTYLPGIINYWDWCSPTLKIMGVKFEEGPTAAQRRKRFDFIRNFKAFRCPENEILAGAYTGGPTFTVDILPSYNTALQFLVQAKATSGVSGTNAQTEVVLPASYNVKLSKVGQGAEKIYIADGSRFTTVKDGPDSDFSAYAQYGGAFSDQGPWTSFSRSWCRDAAQAGARPARDPRIFAYRHGTRAQFKATDSYKANFGFFDGHVELLGDLQSAKPSYWMPRGTVINNAASEFYQDVRDRYGITASTYTAP
jgi:prepilin-type N-terminal cleavage/methylation domain-containing protein/prepilin-type processing-associated H-X9-DG protein